MFHRTTHNVLLISPRPAEELEQQLYNLHNVKKVFRAYCPEEVEAIVRNKKISFVFISVNNWSGQLFSSFVKLSMLPRLVLFQDDGDSNSLSGNGEDICVLHHPFTAIQLKVIIAEWKSGCFADYDCIRIALDGKWQRLSCNDIMLMQSLSNHELLIYTGVADHLINIPLQRLMHMLPPGRFIEIRNDLVIPEYKKDRIRNRGYPFRGGWFPL